MSDGTQAHVDIFGAFYVGETFYLLGDTSGPLPRDVITPLGEIELEGVRLAAPRDPEAMLAFLYGDHWRVPDPAFSRTWPREGIRRLDGWLRGQRNHLREWNDLLFKPGNVALEESPFAAWVDARLPAGEPVVDVGSGNGRDARFFAKDRPVAAYDYAGTALRKTERKVSAVRPDPLVGALPLNDFRAVALAGAELARMPRPHHVYARHLLGCLDEDARQNLWRLAGMALRRGGTISLEFAATGTDAPATPAGLVRRLDPALVAGELRERGYEILETEIGPGTDVLDHPDPSVARLHARWPNRQEQA
jgi:SAM-dependent methyltransferase